jgi:putative transposase
MKTTLQVKLLPSPAQYAALLETMHAFNAACTYIAGIAYEQRLASKFTLQRLLYYEVRQRFRRVVNHTITKKLVAYAKDTKAALSLEELTGIRDRMTVRKGQRNKQHAWSFRQLRTFLAYKAQRLGIPLVCVDPRNTSRTCSRCGFVEKRNRRSQAEFSCLRCGFACHADINAARNLATRAGVARPDLCAPQRGQLAFAW